MLVPNDNNRAHSHGEDNEERSREDIELLLIDRMSPFTPREGTNKDNRI